MILVEIVGLYIFLNMLNCIVIVLLIISFTAIFYIDSVYVLLIIMVWPVVIYLYLILSSVINGVKLRLIMKLIYVVIARVMLGGLIIIYILAVIIIRVAILYVLRSYVSYWMLRVRLLGLSVIIYILSEVKIIWLGILPFTFIFIKQSIIILLFMIKLVWLW